MAEPRTATKHNVYNSRDDGKTFIPCIVINGTAFSIQKHHTKK